MAARDYLTDYGYVLSGDGKYRRPGKQTQVWQELEDGRGWLRFDPDGNGGEIPEAYTIAPEYRETSGLSKRFHPGAFVWVWPDEEVAKIYHAAVEAREKWAAEAVIRKGQAPITPGAVVPPLTPDQLAAIQNAQTGQADAAEAPKNHRWWRKD